MPILTEKRLCGTKVDYLVIHENSLLKLKNEVIVFTDAAWCLNTLSCNLLKSIKESDLDALSLQYVSFKSLGQTLASCRSKLLHLFYIKSFQSYSIAKRRLFDFCFGKGATSCPRHCSIGERPGLRATPSSSKSHCMSATRSLPRYYVAFRLQGSLGALLWW